MVRVDTLEFEKNFELYLDQAIGGETIMVTRDGADYVVLLPYTGNNTQTAGDDIPPG